MEYIICYMCNGTGEGSNEFQICDKCRGSGEIEHFTDIDCIQLFDDNKIETCF